MEDKDPNLDSAEDMAKEEKKDVETTSESTEIDQQAQSPDQDKARGVAEGQPSTGESGKGNDKKPSQAFMNGFSIFIDSITVLIALASLCLGLRKCDEAIDLNKRQEAINAIYQVKENKMLEARARLAFFAVESFSQKDRAGFLGALNSVYSHNDTARNKMEFTYDINYLFNVFDNIALMHKNELVDQKIIKGSICEEVREFKYVYSKAKAFLPSQLDTSNIVYLDSICNADGISDRVDLKNNDKQTKKQSNEN
ncbi:MAG: hypothetical protein H6556_23520 [Lewinellaceae bacterium]|nr:hypothetical protein [Lewinellaceae bacterium]